MYTASWRCVATLVGHVGPVNALLFTVDSLSVASCSDDGSIRQWDVAANVSVGSDGAARPDRLRGHVVAAISCDGRLLATATADRRSNVIRLWDVTLGVCCGQLTGHSSSVGDMEFSPDGRLLASASEDRSARVWTMAGKCTTTSAVVSDLCLEPVVPWSRRL